MDMTGRAESTIALPRPPATPATGGARHLPLPFGAEIDGDGVRFRLWAPAAAKVEVLIEQGGRTLTAPLADAGGGMREARVPGIGAGARYRYRIDGGLAVPDCASRFQPDDVHGASEVIDPSAYRWRCRDWRGRPWEETVLYEVHVGTFSPAGTFAGAARALDHLVDLGVTAIELMPVADFPGRRDWGYNGAYLYAPEATYGRPDDLKALIDAAHARGLMVFLDVVYNHFGPEGNYLHAYAGPFFRADRQTPWGAAIAFDGPDRRFVRDFFIANALYWIEEYFIDGLRLDAVHAIRDEGRPSFLAELAAAVTRYVAAAGGGRHVHLVLENDENEAQPLTRLDLAGDGGADGGGADGGGADGGPRYTAQWNDDTHHALHVLLTGEADAYYRDYADRPVAHLARCLAEGFAYQGEASAFRRGRRRGEPSRALPATAFVNFLQNHDQIGNRAMGERLSRLAPAARLREAAALLLLAPSPPLLFMGEEWAAPEPFLFFCDLGSDLAPSVRDGRRREFAQFPAFASPEALARIPDPTAEETFRLSRLDWQRLSAPPHAGMLAHYRRLLAIRRRAIAPRLAGIRPGGEITLHPDGHGFGVAWTLGDGARLHLLVRFGGTLAPWAMLTPPPGDVLYATGDVAPPGGADGSAGRGNAADGDTAGGGWWVRWSLAGKAGGGERG